MNAEDLNAVAVEAGARAEIAMDIPFTEAPLREALRRVASRHTGGKAVIHFERNGVKNKVKRARCRRTAGAAHWGASARRHGWPWPAPRPAVGTLCCDVERSTLRRMYPS